MWSRTRVRLLIVVLPGHVREIRDQNISHPGKSSHQQVKTITFHHYHILSLPSQSLTIITLILTLKSLSSSFPRAFHSSSSLLFIHPSPIPSLCSSPLFSVQSLPSLPYPFPPSSRESHIRKFISSFPPSYPCTPSFFPS